MAIVGDAFVRILPATNPTEFQREAERGVLGAVGKIAKQAAAIVGGAVIFKGLFQAGKAAFDAAAESNKIAAQTEQVIKSTGAAAQVTAQQVGGLAGALAAKTGIDDEAIQSAENLLLTFTKIRNEVGENNDIFTQATKIALDMGAALGGDAASNAIQLGKALNDPVTGLQALTRVGVTFTAQQKAQIETMVASGDTMGAQKIILAELNKEFGGSAEAQATATGKLKVIIGDIQESIGQKLVPIAEKLASFLSDELPGAVDAAGEQFHKLETVISFLVPVVEAVGRTFKVLLTDVPGVQGAIQALALTFAALKIQSLIGTLAILIGGFGGVAAAAGTARVAITGLLTTIGPVAGTILALGAAYAVLKPTATDAEEATLDFTAALKLVGKAADEAINSVLADDLAKQGLVDTLHAAGLGFEEYASAARGASEGTQAGVKRLWDFQAAVQAAADSGLIGKDAANQLTGAVTEAAFSLDQATNKAAGTKLALKDLADVYGLTAEQVGELAKKVDAAVSAETAHDAAVRAVTDANRGLKDALTGVAAAQLRSSDAARGIQDAARARVDALATQADAEKHLTDLIEGRVAAEQSAIAGRDLEHAQLGVRSAQLSVQSARQHLKELTSSGTASALELRQARLAVDEATVGQKDAQDRLKTSQDDLNTAQNIGKEGSAELKTAQDALATANRGVEDANRGITAAQAAQTAATKGVVDAATAVTDAHGKVRDAELLRLTTTADLAAKTDDLAGKTHTADANLRDYLASQLKLGDIQGPLRVELQKTLDLLNKPLAGAPTPGQDTGNILTGVTQSVGSIFGEMLQTVRESLGIHSPSSEFRRIGEQVAAGFAQGVGGGLDASNLLTLPGVSPITLPTSPAGATGDTWNVALTVSGGTIDGAYATGLETVRQLRADQYRRTGR